MSILSKIYNRRVKIFNLILSFVIGLVVYPLAIAFEYLKPWDNLGDISFNLGLLISGSIFFVVLAWISWFLLRMPSRTHAAKYDFVTNLITGAMAALITFSATKSRTQTFILGLVAFAIILFIAIIFPRNKK